MCAPPFFLTALHCTALHCTALHPPKPLRCTTQMPQYLKNTATGACVRNQHAIVAKDSGPIVVVEGGGGYGQVIAKEAMDIGIAKAKEHGVCVVGLINSHHVGRIGHWGEQCAEHGLVSTHWVNVHGHKSLVSPFGGTESRMGTNPHCTVIPRGGGKRPLVLDFATSEVALGKVRVALNQGQQMPNGMLIDACGNPTTEPSTMYEEPYGAILPFGLHKGGGECSIAGRGGGCVVVLAVLAVAVVAVVVVVVVVVVFCLEFMVALRYSRAFMPYMTHGMPCVATHDDAYADE